MKKLYLMSILVGGVLFLGCSIKEVKLPEVHLKKPTPKAYSCDEEHFVDNYTKEQREAAMKYFLYALFSSDTYDDKPYFPIPNWTRVKRYTSLTGFSADVYEEMNNSKIEKVVIAFRGTDSNPKQITQDFVLANLSIGKSPQYTNAEELFYKIFNDKRYSKAKKIVTGHSLGGGLALHISTKYDNVEAYVFNTSPRVFAPKKIKKNKRVLLYEKGEVLASIRKKWKKLFKKIELKQHEYDFFKNGILKDHSMYALARALLLMAAVNNDKLAIEIQNKVADCGFKFDENKTK